MTDVENIDDTRFEPFGKRITMTLSQKSYLEKNYNNNIQKNIKISKRLATCAYNGCICFTEQDNAGCVLNYDSVSLNNTMPGCASVWFRKHTSSLITQIQDVINYRCMEITVASYGIKTTFVCVRERMQIFDPTVHMPERRPHQHDSVSAPQNMMSGGATAFLPVDATDI